MRAVKNIFDYSLALIAGLVLFIPCLILFLMTSADTGQNGMFKQQRVGRNGKLFYLLKFRSMKGNYTSPITTQEMQITHFGKFLRKYKLDEIPQILNILQGQMSWVGPRPDVPGYADRLTGEDRLILSIKPGITGPAQLKYRHEEEILAQVENPEQYNDEVLWKDKVSINKKYIKEWSFQKDIKYLLQTFLTV